MRGRDRGQRPHLAAVERARRVGGAAIGLRARRPRPGAHPGSQPDRPHRRPRPTAGPRISAGLPGPARGRHRTRRHGPLHRGRRHRAGAGRRSSQPRSRVPGRPRPPRRAGDAPRLGGRRPRGGGARRGPSIRHPVDRRGAARSPGTSPSATTTSSSACGDTATGRRCDRAPSPPRSTGCGGASGSVVADVDADLEGEQATGSLDVEERNAIARTTLLAADLVVVVGLPGMKGLHSLLRTTRDLLAHGVPGQRLLPLVNRAPKSPRARGEIATAFGELLGGAGRGHGVPSPTYLADRRRLEEVVRDRARLPDAWLGQLAGTVQALLDLESTPRRRPRSRRHPPPGPTRDPRHLDGRLTSVRGRRGRASRRRGRARTSRPGSRSSHPGRDRCPRPASRRGWPRRAAPSRCCARTTRG